MTKVNGEDVVKEDIKDTEAEQTVEENAAEDQKADEKVEAAEEKKEEKEAEPEEDGDAKYLRLMADFQNYKKRVEKEKTDLYSYANEKLVTELLAVLDNFERALAHEDSGDGFKEGMAEIAALGEDFDPNFHNAVMTEETEEYESGKVSGVLQKGYTLNGKVIRPSMVKVVS